ncbi:EAL and HDOD domain-containing protein [Halomonas llamarensis]|uniref:EAL domain-containing protein n=1 Tax=Halomonas llamarensis TaxID=2945104 RepID=A0ABT0SUR4_9GAMM|nr:EAL domain-containing protein [Halomonas llamarensis]MCL7931568.1 EAL domain-containing protein [Halomonas llamarensis]
MDKSTSNEFDSSSEGASEKYTIAIQPIVDSRLKHIGDELLYRASDSKETATIVDDVQATARACAMAVYEIGLDKLCGSRWLFINASEDWLANPDLTGLSNDQIIIEVLEDTEPTQAVLNALRSIKEKGYKLALDDFVADEKSQVLLPFCNIVKIDISIEIQEDMIRRLVNDGFTLLAERVETQEDFEYCKALGFTLFQGYFYERPKIQPSTSSRLSASRANQMHLLSALYSNDISLTKISSLVARDPYLLSAVFKRANSGETGTRRPATKLIDCIQMIGLRELRTLVSIIILAANSPASKLNLIKGLTRAFACEMLASRRRLDEQESFVVGLFSLMSVILGVSEKLIAKEIRLGREIEEAVSQRAGALGQVLADVEAMEQQFLPSDVPADTLLKAAAQARSLVDDHSP